jgi:hypothetical protein
VFTPLAFARRESWWPYVALVASMTLFGVWHGAKWTFIAFGVYHGLVLVGHRVGQAVTPRAFLNVPSPVRSVLSWAATFVLLSIGFVLFRAETLQQSVSMIRTAFSPAAYGHTVLPTSFFLLTTAIVGGYFLFVGIDLVLQTWRAQYIEARSEEAVPAAAVEAARNLDVRVAVGGVTEFAAARLWWWLAPAVVTLAFVMSWVMYEQQATIAVTPFIYTLF